MKIRYGMLAGSLSGSQGNTTASHNRYGAYLRMRTVPTRVTSDAAQLAKATLSAASKIWGTLTTNQRTAWKTWALTNPITDTLGEKRILAGSAACTKLNSIILQAGGTVINDPPATAAPFLPDGLAATYDIGAGAFSVTWTGGALGAGLVMYIRVAITDSPGVSYVQNLYKLVKVTAAAATSPQVLDAAVALRFGTLQARQGCFISITIVDQASGLVSGSYPLQGVIIST